MSDDQPKPPRLRKDGKPWGSGPPDKKPRDPDRIAEVSPETKAGLALMPKVQSVADRTRITRHWRESLRVATEAFFAEPILRELYELAMAIARDTEHPDQRAMIEYMIDRAIGKTTAKVEVAQVDSVESLERRIELAKITAGLIQNITVKQMPQPETVEGEIVNEKPVDNASGGSGANICTRLDDLVASAATINETQPAGLSEGAGGDSGIVPSVPAEVHRGPE